MERVTLIRMIVVVFGLVLVAGSCSKKSTKPEPATGSRVYVVVMGDPAKLFTYDGEADTLIDSIALPRMWDLPIPAADPCRPRVAIMNSGGMHIYNADESEPAGVYEVPSVRVAFTETESLLIGTRGGINCTVPGQTVLYRLPGMTNEFEDTLPLADLQVDLVRGIVYGMVNRCKRPGNLDLRDFGSYDYRNRKIEQKWVINPDSAGNGYFIASYHLNVARRWLYASALTPSGFRIVCYDLNAEENVFEIPVDGGREPRLTPDGGELWLADYFGESIAVHDADDGTLLAAIDLSDHRTLGVYPASPLQIRFVPDGSKAYVTCASDPPGPLLVIDTKQRVVTKAFFVDERRHPVFLDIGPAPN